MGGSDFAAETAGPLAAQQADGSWRDPSCPEYGTAAALTVLQMAVGLVVRQTLDTLFAIRNSGEESDEEKVLDVELKGGRIELNTVFSSGFPSGIIR